MRRRGGNSPGQRSQRSESVGLTTTSSSYSRGEATPALRTRAGGGGKRESPRTDTKPTQHSTQPKASDHHSGEVSGSGLTSNVEEFEMQEHDPRAGAKSTNLGETNTLGENRFAALAVQGDPMEVEGVGQDDQEL